MDFAQSAPIMQNEAPYAQFKSFFLGWKKPECSCCEKQKGSQIPLQDLALNRFLIEKNLRNIWTTHLGSTYKQDRHERMNKWMNGWNEWTSNFDGYSKFKGEHRTNQKSAWMDGYNRKIKIWIDSSYAEMPVFPKFTIWTTQLYIRKINAFHYLVLKSVTERYIVPAQAMYYLNLDRLWGGRTSKKTSKKMESKCGLT